MNVVDSSAWLEYFSDGENAEYFLAPLKDTASLVVPVAATEDELITVKNMKRHESFAGTWVRVFDRITGWTGMLCENCAATGDELITVKNMKRDESFAGTWVRVFDRITGSTRMNRLGCD